MNFINMLTAAALGLSLPLGALQTVRQEEPVPVTESGISYRITADYSSITFSVDGSTAETGGVFTVTSDAGTDELDTDKTYDNFWMASCGLEGLVGEEFQVSFTSPEAEYSETVLVPQLKESTGIIEDLYFEIPDAQGNPVRFEPQSAKGKDYLFLPSGADLSKLTVIYDETAAADLKYSFVPVGETSYELSSGASLDLTEPEGFKGCDAVFLDFSFEQDGENKEYIIGVMQSRNIASVFLTSDDPENKGRDYIESSLDHSLKASGSVTVYSSSFAEEYSGKNVQIKGRGNSTWTAAKKPYQIKLDKKADLIDPIGGSQKAKKWLLLSNPFDPTLLHNRVAMDIGYAAGLKETPQGRSVDLYYDGEYRGSYYLCEKIEINENRVDINNLEDDIENVNPDVDMDDLPEADGFNANGHPVHYVDGLKDPENITGGYLLENDSVFFFNEKSYFTCRIGQIVCKQPEYLSFNEISYISEFMDEVIDCTHNYGVNEKTGKTIFDYLDKYSFTRYWLMQEWAKNNDAYTSSTFFFKPQDEDKLYAGPLWDVDASMGIRMTSENPHGWLNVGWGKFWWRSEEFQEAVREVYHDELRPLLEKVLYGSAEEEYSLAGYFENIRYSEAMNFTLWEYGNVVDFFMPRDYAWQNNNDMMQWLRTRTAWMDRQLTGAGGPAVSRIAGSTRYETSLLIADYLRRNTESGRFDNVIVTSGGNYPDALCSGWLASDLDAPVILINEKSAQEVTQYISQSLAEDGRIYVLGGQKAIPEEWISGLNHEKIRISGETRYETNIEILKAVEKIPEKLLVCTGMNYADSLSASAVDMPILLVGHDGLTDLQREWLKEQQGNLETIYIAGGNNAVSEEISSELEAAGPDVIRLNGQTRYQTSRMIAEEFFANDQLKNAVTAYAFDFPDGLCGGTLAKALNAPILLASEDSYSDALDYYDSCLLSQGYVLGGTARFSDEAVRKIYGLNDEEPISLFE